MIDLMGKKYYYFVFSALILVAGIIGYIVHDGFNLDIQFQGGTILEMEMKDSSFSTDKVEDIIKKLIGKEVVAQKSYTINAKDSTKKMNTLIISVSANSNLTDQEKNKVVESLRKEFGLSPSNQLTIRSVDPTIGKELKVNAITAVIVASVLIILYIWKRFQVMSGLSAGVIAVLALFHDILIMLSVYTIFNIKVNESFIAAVLTILGYSMNDTIIIYDRIRENSAALRRGQITELVNKSVIQTLARSINTVVTVLICLITVYLFAMYSNIESIKEFAFPLIIGIASGCYSSIFIASPLFVLWREYQERKRVMARAVKA